MITLFTPARIFDPHNYLDWHFNSKAWEYGRNFMYYENPEVDRLLAQAAATLDDAQARPALPPGGRSRDEATRPRS